MKQLIMILMTTVTMFAASAQTRNLVTLSHDGQLTFFDNSKAFEDAVKAAVDGDVIYLSEGKFGTGTHLDGFTKNVHIIGSGYDSHLLYDLSYSSEYEGPSPSIEGIRLKSLSINNHNNRIMIKGCYIDNAYVGGQNYLASAQFDRCYIKSFGIGHTSCDVNIVNSKIEEYNGYAVVDNCNIKQVGYDSGYFYNSIIESSKENYIKDGVYENCLIGNTNTATDKMFNCYFESGSVLDDNLECTAGNMSSYIGKDGTVVGCYGGPGAPYSEQPTVPTVDSANSSVEYDKEGNKLNVTISVTPN